MAEMLPTVKVKKGKGEITTINAADLAVWTQNGYKVVSDSNDHDGEAISEPETAEQK